MHEIGLLRQLVRTVTSFAEENDVHNIAEVAVDCGELSLVIPEYLEAESQCQQMYVEHMLSATTLAVSLDEPDGKQVRQKVDYPDGKNIFDVIDEECAAILVEKYKEYMHHKREAVRILMRAASRLSVLDHLLPVLLSR